MTEQKYVLVVDDEQQLTTFLREFLAKAGYQMSTATSGEEALNSLKAHLPSLMLLDMRLPGIDGIQVLRSAKESFPSLKVIVMTSFDEEYKQAAESCGADAFFPKPISLAELSAKIEELLNPNDPPAALREAPSGMIPKAKLLFITPNPHAAILMKGAIHCVGDAPVEEELKEYSDAGEYDLEEASTHKEVLDKVSSYRPDIVLVSADWKEDEIGFLRTRHYTSSDLITEIMRSPHHPKEVLLFGSSGENSSNGGTVLQEPGWADFEKQASKINRILWQKCITLGLTTRHPA